MNLCIGRSGYIFKDDSDRIRENKTIFRTKWDSSGNLIAEK